MTVNLGTRAMLARLTIKTWSATCLDRKVTDKATSDHNAAADAGRFNKRLVSKDALAALTKVCSEARAEHYKRTSPWQDDGTRILTVAGFDAYAAELDKLAADFIAEADKFAAGYPEFVTDARTRLNGMFKESDYPKPELIRKRFQFETTFTPLPESADFRAALSDAQAERIRAEIECRTRDAVADAMRDVYQRVADNVGHMASKLREFKPAQGKGERANGVFRDSLVGNVRELSGLLASLNITGDARLSAIADRMARELCEHDAEGLRDSDAIRATVAAKAEAILKDVSEYLA
jgi:hypothetical protein